MPIDKERKQVWAERVIAAPAQQIFDVLANPQMHPVIDGSGTVQAVPKGPERLSDGATFGVSMKIKLPYRIGVKVREWDEPRLIGWAHVARATWRYELTPEGDATRVRETFDWGTARPGVSPFVKAVKFPEANLRSIEKTLERLDRYVTTGSVD